MSDQITENASPQAMKDIWGHPRGLFILFFAELWERFSFYGMRALLTLYMVKELLYADQRAYGVYAAYGAFVYAMPVIGGILADRLLGCRLAVMIGAVLMALGHFAMAFPDERCFYFALALLCLGNGFFKPNISTIVGKLYGENDPRRDGGFTIFYMGINIGAFFSPLVCGAIGEIYGWHYGFGIAGVGMLVGLIFFGMGGSWLGGHGDAPDAAKLKAPFQIPWTQIRIKVLNNLNVVFLGCLVMLPILALGLWKNMYSSYAMQSMMAIVLGYLIYTAFTLEKEARDMLLVVVVLMFFHTTFWALFEQAGSSLTLFAERNVDRHLFGVEVKASLFQAVNPFFIILLGIPFAWMWTKLKRVGHDPSFPMKFVLGLVQAGLGFAILVLGAKFATNGLVPVFFLIACYFVHTTGELCLSPVGLSMVTKLAPRHLVATVMGSWFLSVAFAHYVAGFIAKLTGIQSGNGEVAPDPTQTLTQYTSVFWDVFWAALAVACLLLVLTPLLKKWTHGRH